MQAAGMDTGAGQVILAVAVLSILLTAPAGAWAISFVGDRVLKQERRLTTTSADSISITEDDIAHSIRVDEVMESDIIAVQETETLRDVFHAFSESDFIVCPIINSDGHFMGMVCMDDIRPLLLSHHTLEWLIAGDICRPLGRIANPCSFLSDALHIMTDEHLHEIPVVEPRTSKVVGLLNYEKTQRYVKEKWLEINNGQFLHQTPEKTVETKYLQKEDVLCEQEQNTKKR